MSPARDAGGHLVLILHDDASGADSVGTAKGLKALAKSDVTVDASGIPTSARGYTLIKGAELFTLDQQLGQLVVPTANGAGIRAQGVARQSS